MNIARYAIRSAVLAALGLVAVPDSASAQPAPPPSPAPAKPPEVFDFCAMPPPREGAFKRQRLVIFELGGRDVVLGPEKEVDEKGNALTGVTHNVFRDAAINEDVKNAFGSEIPMHRFITVEAKVEAPPEIRKRPTVSDHDMVEAAKIDTFAAYSIACADWVFLPRVVGKDTEWKKIQKERVVGGRKVPYQAWHMHTTLKLEADLYQHDANGFTLVKTALGENSKALELAVTLAGQAPQRGSKLGPPAVSKRPDPTCHPPIVGELADVMKGMTDCASAISALRVKAEAALGADTKAHPEGPTDPEAPKPAPATESKPEPAPPKPDAAPAPPSNAGVPSKTSPLPKVEIPVKAPDVPMSEEERALLKTIAGADPAGIEELLASPAVAKAQGAVALVSDAKNVAVVCKKPVDEIGAAASKLHEISQKGVSGVGVDAVLGLAKCAGIDLTVDLSNAQAPGSRERKSHFCENVEDDVALGTKSMAAVARCEGRVASEIATLDVANNIKKTKGIQIVGRTKLRKDGALGIQLGVNEDIQRGQMYVSTDGSAFGRLVGTSDEDSEPHPFKPKKGNVDENASMEEHPQIGVLLGARPQVSLLAIKGDLTTTVAYGAAIEGGYNASKFAPVGDEVWGRAIISYVVGTHDESFLTFELTPEIVHYLFGGLSTFAGAGPALTFVSKEVTTGPGTTAKLSGYNFGILLNGGLDYAVAPDWDVRLSAGYRQGVSKANLDGDGTTAKVDAGLMSSFQAGLSVLYTF